MTTEEDIMKKIVLSACLLVISLTATAKTHTFLHQPITKTKKALRQRHIHIHMREMIKAANILLKVTRIPNPLLVSGKM